MLELPDEDFKASIIENAPRRQTLLKWIDGLGKEKEPNVNLKNEKYNNSLQGSASKMEMTKEK